MSSINSIRNDFAQRHRLFSQVDVDIYLGDGEAAGLIDTVTLRAGRGGRWLYAGYISVTDEPASTCILPNQAFQVCFAAFPPIVIKMSRIRKLKWRKIFLDSRPVFSSIRPDCRLNYHALLALNLSRF